MPDAKLDPKWLDGLTYRSSKLQQDKDGDARRVPTERPLAPNDVLNWRDAGDTVVIVTADGRKHGVEKHPKKGK